MSTVVTLTPSSRRQCVNVTIIPDSIFEGYESFFMELSRSLLPSYVVLSPDVARVTIYDT